MKIICIPLTLLLILSSCSQDPQRLLEEAKQNLLTQKNIHYQQLDMYPNPIGEVDTSYNDVRMVRNENNLLGFDFIYSSNRSDLVYLNEEFFKVEKANKQIINHSVLNEKQLEKLLTGGMNVTIHSPLQLLKRDNWNFLKDTLEENQTIKDFYMIENDTIRDGNSIYTEQHIFINPETKLLKRYERRNYFNGNLSQRVVYLYQDYEFTDDDNILTYSFPKAFTTVLYGKKSRNPMLKIGQKMPLFAAENLEGEVVKIEDYLGKKILLDFSIINCGYCHQSIKYMNQSNFQISEDIIAFYVNPYDQLDDIKKYHEKMNIPLRILLNTDDIGDLFGVYSYPLFMLINEDGELEKIGEGFDKEFLDNLKGSTKS